MDPSANLGNLADLAQQPQHQVQAPGFAAAAPEGHKVVPRLHESTVLKLKGLPYTATAEDIHAFFTGHDVLNVAFVREPDGRPSGLAFAEFATKEEALKALAKNGDYLGERYIRLLHVPRAEMEEQVRLGTLAVPGAAARMRSRAARASVHPQQPQQQPHRGGVAYLSGPVQLVSAVMPSGRPVMALAHTHNMASAYGTGGPVEAPRIWQTGYPAAPGQYQAVQQAQPMMQQGQPLQQQQQYQQQQYQQQQYQQQHQPSPAQLASQLSGLTLGGMPSQQQQQPGLPQQQPQQAGGVPRGAGMVQLSGPAGASLHAVPAQGLVAPRPLQAATSPVVKIRGLPYRALPNEILAFFQGYNFIPDSLQIGLDQLGRPSGEAWLTFISPQEALRAVRDLNRHYLGNRYLELSIC